MTWAVRRASDSYVDEDHTRKMPRLSNSNDRNNKFSRDQEGRKKQGTRTLNPP